MINVSDDYSRVKWLKEQQTAGGVLEYPQVYIGDVRVGSMNHLVAEDGAGRIDSLLRENRTSSLSLSVSGMQCVCVFVCMCVYSCVFVCVWAP